MADRTEGCGARRFLRRRPGRIDRCSEAALAQVVSDRRGDRQPEDEPDEDPHDRSAASRLP